MIRSFLHFTIERPILNHIFFVLLFVLALFAYRDIPKEIFPPFATDKVVVSGGYPGASADVLDKMAVHSLEDGMKSIDNIDNILSTIQNGRFVVQADIKSGSDKQVVLGDVKNAITSLRRDLPTDMNDPVAKIVINRFPLLMIAVSGEVSKKRLLDAAHALKQRLNVLKNLDRIDLRGDAEEEVHLRVDERKLEALHIPKLLLYQAVSALSSIYPAGTFKNRGNLIYLSTENGKKNARSLADTQLKIGGRYVRLGEVADVEFGLGEPQEISHYNGRESVSLIVSKTKKGNALRLSGEVRQLLETFKKEYPDVDFTIYVDTSNWIRNRINLVTSNIFFGLILVFGALFLSMNWRIASVVAIGIPTSFFIALIAAEGLGYSMNMLTMLGVLVALGMIVDEAIVVAENIYRHMEMGKPPLDAAIDGASEMFPAVLTATGTTIFAFLPLLTMSGEMGVFVKVLPVMISILLLSSLFEAYYFLPLHSEEFFTFGHRVDHHEPSRFWDTLSRWYGRLLSALLRHKYVAFVSLFGLIVGATLYMASITKFELMPTFDGTQIYISGEVDIDARLAETERAATQVEQMFLASAKADNLASATLTVGMRVNPDQSITRGKHIFQLLINLHEPKAKNVFDKYLNPYLSLEYDGSDMVRSETSQSIEKRLNRTLLPRLKKLRARDGSPLFRSLTVFVPQAGIVKNDIEIGLSGADDSTIFATLERLQTVLRRIRGVVNVRTNAQEGPRELKLRINGYGQQLGFTEEYLVASLRGLLLDAEYGKQFDQKGLIRLRLVDPRKDREIDIGSIRLRTQDGSRAVPLRDIVTFVYKKSMLHVYKEGGERVWSVMAKVDKSIVLPTEVMERLAPELDTIRNKGIEILVKGEQKADRQLKRDIIRASVMALFLIFISLVWMFNSLVQPLIVLSAVPLSVLGALVGTKLFGFNMTAIGSMGIVGLAGVVVNDGLIMVDFIRRAKGHREIVAGATIRLRPIVLTSITTVLGLLTIMLFASGQAIIVQPMAIVLGFGVAWATVLNLIYIPLLYTVLYRIKEDEKGEIRGGV